MPLGVYNYGSMRGHERVVNCYFWLKWHNVGSKFGKLVDAAVNRFRGLNQLAERSRLTNIVYTYMYSTHY